MFRQFLKAALFLGMASCLGACGAEDLENNKYEEVSGLENPDTFTPVTPDGSDFETMGHCFLAKRCVSRTNGDGPESCPAGTLFWAQTYSQRACEYPYTVDKRTGERIECEEVNGDLECAEPEPDNPDPVEPEPIEPDPVVDPDPEQPIEDPMEDPACADAAHIASVEAGWDSIEAAFSSVIHFGVAEGCRLTARQLEELSIAPEDYELIGPNELEIHMGDGWYITFYPSDQMPPPE